MDITIIAALAIGVLLGLGLLMAYFWPTLRAHDVRHPDFASIFIINGLLGWMLVPWALTLAWAYRHKPVEMKKCPYCDEEVRIGAVKCKHCRSAI